MPGKSADQSKQEIKPQGGEPSEIEIGNKQKQPAEGMPKEGQPTPVPIVTKPGAGSG
jgi:hypothetical protein